MPYVIAIKTTRYSDFFRRVLAEYSEGVTIEIDGKQHGAGDIAYLLKEWCTNSQICRTRNFKLCRGNVELFGFHDHPRELIAAFSEQAFVERLEREKVLRFRILKQKQATGWRLLRFWPFTQFWVGLIVVTSALGVGCIHKKIPPDAALAGQVEPSYAPPTTTPQATLASSGPGIPKDTTAQTRAAKMIQLRQRMSGITLEDGISKSEAYVIATCYFDRHILCGLFDHIRDGGSFWIVEAGVGIAGTPVKGFHIEKKTGKITSPIGPSYSNPFELLQ